MVNVQVLLASYNGEKYISEQLSSLQSQDYQNFSVIIQDDGSSDGTMDIVRNFCRSDSRFSVSPLSGNHFGAKNNFLQLLRLADAPYAAFCDQDDVWLSNKISDSMKAMNQLESKYGADTPLLVHCNAMLTDSDGNVISTDFFSNQHWSEEAVTLEKLIVQNNASGCMMLMNKALYSIVCSFDVPDEAFMHDWWIALTAAAFGHIRIVGAPLIKYRQHGNNALGASKKSLLSRGLHAFSDSRGAKQRIQLTYTQSNALLKTYAKKLPDSSRQLLEKYSSTAKMNKIRRVIEVRRLGCTMQSAIFRAGQILFG